MVRERNPVENGSIGFLTLKNGAKSHRFMLWNSDVMKIDRDPRLQAMFKTKNVITVRVKRDRDYKEGKTFILDLEKIKQLDLSND